MVVHVRKILLSENKFEENISSLAWVNGSIYTPKTEICSRSLGVLLNTAQSTGTDQVNDESCWFLRWGVPQIHLFGEEGSPRWTGSWQLPPRQIRRSCARHPSRSRQPGHRHRDEPPPPAPSASGSQPGVPPALSQPMEGCPTLVHGVGGQAASGHVPGEQRDVSARCHVVMVWFGGSLCLSHWWRGLDPPPGQWHLGGSA